MQGVPSPQWAKHRKPGGCYSPDNGLNIELIYIILSIFTLFIIKDSRKIPYFSAAQFRVLL